MGHTANSGCHFRFINLRIPASHVLASTGSGKALKIISAAFTMTAALVGAMVVGILRKTCDAALRFTKKWGTVTLLSRQSVSEVLINIKTSVEASRYLAWKAAQSVEIDQGDRKLAYDAEIRCSEASVSSVSDAIRVIGTYDYQTCSTEPFRQLQKVFLQDGHMAWRESSIRLLRKPEGLTLLIRTFRSNWCLSFFFSYFSFFGFGTGQCRSQPRLIKV